MGAMLVTGSDLNFEKASLAVEERIRESKYRDRKSVFIYLYTMGSYCMYCSVTWLFFFLKLMSL